MNKYAWLTTGFSLFLLLILMLANNGSDLILLFTQFPMADKIGHFSLFGALAFLVNKALSCRTRIWFGKVILVGSFWVLALVALEELSQIFINTRQFDVTDFMYDCVGIYLGGFVAVLTDNLTLPDAKIIGMIRKSRL